MEKPGFSIPPIFSAAVAAHHVTKIKTLAASLRTHIEWCRGPTTGDSRPKRRNPCFKLDDIFTPIERVPAINFTWHRRHCFQSVAKTRQSAISLLDSIKLNQRPNYFNILILPRIDTTVLIQSRRSRE